MIGLNFWAAILTNGGFERVGPEGVPVGWTYYWAGGELGKDVFIGVTHDAFEGRNALHMKVTSKATLGLNRSYPTVGRGKEAPIGSLIPKKRGAILFRYKLISTSGDNVRLYVIPMKADNFEGGARRTTYILPPQFAGDGRWHLGVVAFDYTAFPEVRTVQVAPRINEGGKPGPGEVIFDDIRYVERAGWHLRLAGVKVEPSGEKPAVEGVLAVEFENTGDEPAPLKGIEVTASKGLRLEPLQIPDRVEPGKTATLKWKVIGPRKSGMKIAMTWPAVRGEVESAKVVLKPKVRLLAFGPERTVVGPGGEVELLALIENTGEATAEGARVKVDIPEPFEVEGESEWSGDIEPGRKVLRWRVRAKGPGVARLEIQVGCEGLEGPSQAEFIAVCSNLSETSGGVAVQCGSMRLLFPKNPFGYGVCIVETLTNEGRRRVARLPWLGLLSYLADDGTKHRVPLYAAKFERVGGGLRFEAEHKDRDGRRWALSVLFVPSGTGEVEVRAKLSVDKPGRLLALHVPTVLVGEGSFGKRKDWALLPGIFYMLPSETSLDLSFADPPFNDQHAPHPYKVTAPVMAVLCDGALVGLMWDPLQRWDGENIAPSCLFASPDWVSTKVESPEPVPERVLFQDHHLLGLFLPSIPKWVKENTEEAEKPYEMSPARPLRLVSWLLAGPAEEVTDAIYAYFEKFGLPSLPEMPRTYEETLEMCKAPRRPRHFGRLFGLVEELAGQVVEALESQAPDGSWKFHMDPGNTARLMKFAPHRETLGPEGDTTLGTCTFRRQRAIALWRFARLTNCLPVLEAAKRALDYIERNFVRPEGAQTWEVPLHCPDILAAGYAIHLYLEAYRVTGERRYIERAKYWARTGLPFLYFWNPPSRPRWMRFADIPVLGVSYFNAACWFGTPVQWCGLAYATDLQRLAFVLDELGEHKEARFWRHIAEGVTICGMQMQIEEGPRRGNYPDSVSLTYAYRRNDPGIIGPGLIVENIHMLLYPGEAAVDFYTRVLRTPAGAVHVSAEARIVEARLEGDKLTVKVRAPEDLKGTVSQVLIAPVARPERVLAGGRELPLVKAGLKAWWRYIERLGGVLEIQVVHEKPEVEIAVEGLRAIKNQKLPGPSEPVWNFDAEGDPEGWAPTHDLASFEVSGGRLKTRSTGPDPYMIGPPIRADAKRYKFFVVRMRVKVPEGGRPDGQVFWARQDEPYFSEPKSMHFELLPDGRWHTYRVPVHRSEEWRGVITRLRLDPGAGAAGIEVEIDRMRLE